MALNSSGQISLAGSTTGQSIAVELGLGATTQISLDDSTVRGLAGVASGVIVMPTNFYGKANTYSLLIYVNGGGGGSVRAADYPSSGAGGGGYSTHSGYSVAPGGPALTIAVGAGGAANWNHCAAWGNAGGSSSISGGPSMTASGGGGGGGGSGCTGGHGRPGGSGGGASGGTTNTSGQTGGTAPSSRPGPGAYGGASYGPYGGAATSTPGVAVGAYPGNNYGGGAAGGGCPSDGFTDPQAGAQGVVVIRYLGAQKGTGGTVTYDGTYTTHTFTSSGTYSP